MSEEWIRQYEGMFPKYDDFAERLEALLKDLVSAEGIDLFHVEHRAKEVAKFVEKISREGKGYRDPLSEITDLAGIRIICFYNHDVDSVARVVESNFSIDIDNSVDKRLSSDPDRFGYQSLHYVVSLGDERRGLAEWRKFNGLKAEVQIRTVLQHAWAAIDHKLRYKNNVGIPDQVKRELFKVSAVLDVADDCFSSVATQIEKIRKEYISSIKKEDTTGIPVNIESIEAFLNQNNRKKLIGSALDRSSILLSDDDDDMYDDDDARGDLIRALSVTNIRTIHEFSKFVESSTDVNNIEKVCAVFKRYGDALHGKEAFFSPYGILRVMLVVYKPEYAVATLSIVPFGDVFTDALFESLGLPRPVQEDFSASQSAG